MIKDIIFDWQGVLRSVKLNKGLLTWIEKNNQYGFSILSNYSGNIKEQLKRVGRFSNFKAIITPREYSLYKPDKEIFNILLKNIDRKADQCLFVDDSLTNINAADQLGFKTIHYKNNSDFFNKIDNL